MPRLGALRLRNQRIAVAIGAAAAVPAALALGRLTESQLHGVEPADPLNMLTAAAILAIVALAAGYLPARRAARTDPMQALRSE